MFFNPLERTARNEARTRLFFVERCSPIIPSLDEVHDYGSLGAEDSIDLVDLLINENSEVIKGFDVEIDVDIRTARREGNIPDLVQVLEFFDDGAYLFRVDVDLYVSYNPKADSEGIADGNNLNDSFVDHTL